MGLKTRPLQATLCAGAALWLLAGCVPSMEKLKEMANKPVIYGTNFSLDAPAFVACRDTPLLSEPNRMAAKTDILSYGAPVVPVDYKGEYLLPDSQQEKHSGREMAPEKKHTATWAKVKTDKSEGWVAALCLADAKLQARQDPNGKPPVVVAAESRARGFSEEQVADQSVMRGGTGALQRAACTGNCNGLPIVDRLIADTPMKDAVDSTRAFRSAGKLGEYK